jgi:cytoskeletal protein RodZ
VTDPLPVRPASAVPRRLKRMMSGVSPAVLAAVVVVLVFAAIGVNVAMLRVQAPTSNKSRAISKVETEPPHAAAATRSAGTSTTVAPTTTVAPSTTMAPSTSVIASPGTAPAPFEQGGPSGQPNALGDTSTTGRGNPPTSSAISPLTGGPPAAAVPEAGLALLLPVSAGAAIAGAVALRRRRRARRAG